METHFSSVKSRLRRLVEICDSFPLFTIVLFLYFFIIALFTFSTFYYRKIFFPPPHYCCDLGDSRRRSLRSDFHLTRFHLTYNYRLKLIAGGVPLSISLAFLLLESQFTKRSDNIRSLPAVLKNELKNEISRQRTDFFLSPNFHALFSLSRNNQLPRGPETQFFSRQPLRTLKITAFDYYSTSTSSVGAALARGTRGSPANQLLILPAPSWKVLGALRSPALSCSLGTMTQEQYKRNTLSIFSECNILSIFGRRKNTERLPWRRRVADDRAPRRQRRRRPRLSTNQRGSAATQSYSLKKNGLPFSV